MTIKKILNHTSDSIATAAIVLAGASLVSRVLGLVRDRLLTYHFGAGDVLDTYYAAFRLPDFLYNLLIIGALSSAFIPIFSEYVSKGAHARAWKFMNTSIATLGTIFFGISLVCAIGAPLLMVLIAPGFSGDKYTLTVHLTQIMMISPVLMGLSAVVGGALQSMRKFLLYAFAPIMYNLGIILGILLFVPIMGPTGLAVGVVLGAALHLIIQLPALFESGFRPKWEWGWKEKDVQLLLVLMAPRAIALAAVQLNLLVITSLASELSSGSVAIFNLANNIQSLPIGIIAVSYAVAAFPLMTEFAAQDNPDGIARTVASTLRMVLTWIVPIAVLFIVLRAQWVRIILGTGNFDWNATITTADTLGFFALGLVGQACVHTLARGFYALKDTKTPAITAIGATLFSIIVALLLMRPLGVRGLAFASALEATLNALILWALLHKRLGSIDDNRMIKTGLKLFGAAIIMGFIVQGLKNPIAYFVDMQTFWGIFLQAVGASLGGLIVYIGIGLLLHSEELHAIIDASKLHIGKLNRIRVPVEMTDTSN